MASRKKQRKEDSTTEGTAPLTAKARYEQLAVERQPYLQRAYECADLTIPALFPRPGTTSATAFVAPYQGVGAEGVNNLASKLMLALFPPGSAFFRLSLDDFVLAQLQEKTGEQFADARAEFEDALAKMERAVMNDLETNGVRLPLFEGFKQIAVTGNALLQDLDDGGIKLHKLSHFVVKRDSAGDEMEIVVLEELDKRALPPRARDLVDAELDETSKDDRCELYTRIVRTDVGWTIGQEICGKVVPESQGTYPLGKSPWLPQRFTAVDGEDYGRGFVEERIGDLRSLESLTQSMVEGTAIAAKVVFGVNESGVTSKKQLADAANGGVIDGNLEKDVTVLRVDKQADFATANALLEKIQKRLERAFLLLSGVQRDAERVTAEEVRAVVTELETALGGFYSTMSQELQHPLVVRRMAQMAKRGKLPHLPKGTVEPKIVTGLDGLGRSSDLAKLDALMDRLVKAIGPEACAQRLSVDSLVKLYGAALGGDYKDLVKSDAVMQQEAAAAQQAEVAKAAIGPGIKAVSDHALAANAPTQGAPQ